MNRSVNRDVLYEKDAAVWFVPAGVRVTGMGEFTPIVGVNDSPGVNCWLVKAPGDELVQLGARKWIRRDGSPSVLTYQW